MTALVVAAAVVVAVAIASRLGAGGRQGAFRLGRHTNALAAIDAAVDRASSVEICSAQPTLAPTAVRIVEAADGWDAPRTRKNRLVEGAGHDRRPMRARSDRGSPRVVPLEQLLQPGRQSSEQGNHPHYRR